MCIACCLCRIQGSCDLMTVDMGTAAALISGLFRIFSDKGDLFALCQRQHILILQQYNGLFRHFLSNLMVVIQIKHRFGISVLGIAIYDVQNTFHCGIQYLFLQCSVLYRFYDQLIIDSHRGRHLQIETCF